MTLKNPEDNFYISHIRPKDVFLHTGGSYYNSYGFFFDIDWVAIANCVEVVPDGEESLEVLIDRLKDKDFIGPKRILICKNPE